MRKRLAFLSAGLTFGVVVVAVACGDSEPDNVFPGGNEDASFDTGPGFIREGGNDDDAGPIICNPALPTAFKPTWVAPTRVPNACTTEELGQYYDTCLPNFDKKPCTDWLAAHADCGSCIQKDDNSGAVQVFKEPAVFYRFNQGGCVALVQNQAGADKCGAAFEAATECRRASCENCLAKGGKYGESAGECTSDEDPTTYICCQVKSVKAGCSTYETKQDQACGPSYRSPDGGAPNCFKTTSLEADRDLYIRGMGIFCGPP